MPTFCRHNRFATNCPICAPDLPGTAAPDARPTRPAASAGAGAATGRPRGRTARGGGVRIRHVGRAVADGYRCALVPGVKASGDAARLADELAFAAARLDELASDPPGLYAEAAADEDREEATWLCLQIAYLGPLDDDDPFAGIRAARTPWASGCAPALDGVPAGPRASYDAARNRATFDAYRAWAVRAGSQTAALGGEPGWTPERRFARAFERLALPGLHRDARFDFLVTLRCLGLGELHAGALALGGSGPTTLAAKRMFGIGDALLLERRARELAAACELPLAALDLALFNWERPLGAGGPVRMGASASVEAGSTAYRNRAAAALGL